MKKFISVLCLIVCTHVYAFSSTYMPSPLFLKNIGNKEKQVQLLYQDTQVGLLKKRAHTTGTFDFYDEHRLNQITLRYTGNTYLRHILNFDVYNRQQEKIAKLEFLFNPKAGTIDGVTVYTPNKKNTLMSGYRNLLGTRHKIYYNDYTTIAEMTRPLFTWSRDSTLVINDDNAFVTLNPNLFAATIALYCSQDGATVDNSEQSKTPANTSVYQTQLQNLAQQRGLDTIQDNAISESQLETASNILVQRYQEIYGDNALNGDVNVKQFIEFSCNLIATNSFSPIEEKAMIIFLTEQLNSIGL